MVTKGVNRFALFAVEDEEKQPQETQSPGHENPFTNQVADDDAPWQEVKRAGQGQSQKIKTLVIRDENRPPPIHHRSKQSRDVSGSTQGSTGVDKPHNPYEHWCGVCNHKFGNKAALLAHIKQSSNHQNYCNLCKRVFKDRNGLKNHVDNSQGHDVSCNLCLSAFKDQWGLKNHFENNYSVGHEYVCLTCLLGFRSKVELEQHLQTGEKHVWCHTCHRRFRTQDERDEHWVKTMKHKHCLQTGCDFDAPSMNILEKHLKDDHFQCEGCKRIFPSQTQLTRHYDDCRFDVPCPICGQRCAGQVKLAEHMETCFSCTKCAFHTHHEGNYKIHMTKHLTSALACWSCEAPMATYSNLIGHLESGKCPSFPNPSILLTCLGRWWYSPLYMDLDVHAQIRRNAINIMEAMDWMEQDVLHPFICRASGCGKTFAQCSSLVLHVEDQACEWDIERLRLDLLQEEFRRVCVRRDSVFD